MLHILMASSGLQPSGADSTLDSTAAGEYGNGVPGAPEDT